MKPKPDQASPGDDTRTRNEQPDQPGAKAPRLPHEHDESSDSQKDEPDPVIEQAHKDIERGLVDTDRHATPGVEQVEQPGTGGSRTRDPKP
jgi:hypothetical protein